MNRRFSDRALTLLRFYIGGNAIVAWHNALSNPRSFMHQATVNFNGDVLIWLMAILGSAVVFDVLVNDMLPCRYHWRGAIKYRHLLLCALAFCYVAQLYVGVRQYQVVSLLIYYLWNAGAILLASFLDAKLRSRDNPCAVTFN